MPLDLKFQAGGLHPHFPKRFFGKREEGEGKKGHLWPWERGRKPVKGGRATATRGFQGDSEVCREARRLLGGDTPAFAPTCSYEMGSHQPQAFSLSPAPDSTGRGHPVLCSRPSSPSLRCANRAPLGGRNLQVDACLRAQASWILGRTFAERTAMLCAHFSDQGPAHLTTSKSAFLSNKVN